MAGLLGHVDTVKLEPSFSTPGFPLIARNPAGLFPADDGALPLCAPAIQFRLAVFTNHPVAGNQDGNSVARHRSADYALRFRLRGHRSQVAVGKRMTGRNPHQRFPHLDLEIGAAQQQAWRSGFGESLKCPLYYFRHSSELFACSR